MDRRRALLITTVLVALALGIGIRLRVAKDWAFFGSDTYGYFRLAQEWTAEGRFAQGAPPEELQWYRRPLYPALVAMISVDHAAPWSKIHHQPIQWVQSVLDVLVSALLVFFCARRLSGTAAGLTALFLAVLCPLTIAYTSAVLTETIAMVFTMWTVAPLILGRARPMIWFPVAAAGVAMASLLRPEGPLLGLSLLPALLTLPAEVDSKRRVKIAAACGVAFVVLFAAWPIRNLHEFGAMNLVDGQIDRTTHHVPYYKGYWDWLRSWSPNYRPFEFPQSCFYDLKCQPSIGQYDALGAFAGGPADERAEVEKLIERRRTEGVSHAISDGFAQLARARRSRHPLTVLIGLPAARAWHMWAGPQDELYSNPNWRPWRAVSSKLLPGFPALHVILVVMAVIGLITLFQRDATRPAAWILFTTLLVRSAVLGWTGFCLPRYVQPVYCLVFLLAGVAPFELIRRLPAKRFRPTIDWWTRGASSSS